MQGTRTTEVICNDELIFLSVHRTAYWPSEKMLILADLHLGKTGYFRTHGIPIPSSVVHHDLERLSRLIAEFKPEQLLVVGDLFHHKYNSDILIFREWRQLYSSLNLILVPGNHDRHIKIDYAELGIQVTEEEYLVGAINFIHEMKATSELYFTVSGHLHPGYQMSGRARQMLRLPCFIHSPQHLLLPAFSSFTGLFTGYPRQENDQYIVIGDHGLYNF